MREILIRISCFLLGVLLTLCSILVGERFVLDTEKEEVAVVEEIMIEPETVDKEIASVKPVAIQAEYEEEAEEKLAQFQAEAEKKKLEQETIVAQEEKTVSANSIEAAPVKWIKDYPNLNSDKTLEEKELERSSYEETLAVNAFDKKVIENSTIDFSDVKITILGDSLTEGSNLDKSEQETSTYPVILQDILGCKEIVNLGIGGSTVSTAGADAMVERWGDIPKDSDIIIVFGGTNDSLFENKWEFGHVEYDRRIKEDTFCGDLDTLLSKIEYVYQKHNDENYCKLIYINPPSTVLNDAVYAINPENMIHQKEFAEAINQIAPEYEFEVIDFYNNNILNTHDRDVQEQFMPDGVHGNAEGYRIMAEHIASQIIQRIEQ